LAGLVSTANLATLISTSYLATQLGSTVVGLSNVAVTQITAGNAITILPTGGTGNVTVTGTPSNWAGYAASTNVDLAGHSITNAGSVLAGYVYSSSGFGYAGIQFSTNDINIIPYAAGGGNVNITNGNLDMCNNNITNLCNINGSAYPPPSSWVGTATTDLDMCNYNINNVNNISASNVYYHSVLSNIDGVQTDFSVGSSGLYVWNNSGPGTYNYAPVFAQVYITPANSPGGNTYYFLDGLGTGASGSIQAFVAYNSNTAEPASLYISTLYFGNNGATVNGQLTTDSTATNLYWQGNQINPINGSCSVSPSYGYTANVSVGISGLTLGGIVMITPLDDLTESGATVITYCCVPNTGFFTIYLNVPSSFSFGAINNYHSFMYNVVAL